VYLSFKKTPSGKATVIIGKIDNRRAGNVNDAMDFKKNTGIVVDIEGSS